MEKIIAEFTDFTNESNWVSCIVGNFTFEAKLFDSGSMFGINNGRVRDTSKKEIVSYDRGWDTEPCRRDKPYYNAVMELLENSPQRFL